MAITNPSAEDYYSYEYKNFKENITSKHICQRSHREESSYSNFELLVKYYKELCTPIANKFLQQHSEDVLSIIASKTSRDNYILFSIYHLEKDDVMQAVKDKISPEFEEKIINVVNDRSKILQVMANAKLDHEQTFTKTNGKLSAIGVFRNFLLRGCFQKIRGDGT
ncbi:DUF4359 domain-containing protein [Nostoc sp. KVJ3]|uniref:DUF4359 domain-containing protein n=1 Tax=Nostoc sp. KVJ3 TaxID=457945 RepID=UPI002238E606|nr:DUF4359 domain-containing protein [Nostoc sp. KVJ3]MCW5312966.1 DUF4359 domain-containing protein [Nostoc sp. KVJ3]